MTQQTQQPAKTLSPTSKQPVRSLIQCVRLALPIGLLSLGQASAATYTVTHLGDTPQSDMLSLREAIVLANMVPTGDVIEFAEGLNGIITLESGELSIATNSILEIQGDGRITIRGNDSINRSRVLAILSSANVTLNGLTIAGGLGTTGGGILVNPGASLTLNYSTVSGNTANSGGGGIFAGDAATVVLNNSTVSGNSGDQVGGGIAASGASLTLNNSTIFDNSALRYSGIVVSNTASATLNNSIISDCWVQSGSSITLQNTLIEDGSCGASAPFTGDPNLGPLTGSPAYHPLNAPSPAINAGDNDLIPDGITTDQAGNPRISGDTVDLGSHELFVPELSITVSSSEVAEGSNVTFTLTRTDTTGELVVALEVLTDANTFPGIDYSLSGAAITGQTGTVQVTIPDGQSSVQITLSAAQDAIAEGDNLVELSLQSSVDYLIDPTAAAAGVTILAEDFLVNAINDQVDGSLRQAILNANAVASDDVIAFDEGLEGTITLTGDELSIANNGNLEINGDGRITVSGDNASRVFLIQSSANVTLDGLTITAGATSLGGGVQMLSGTTVAINNATVSGNAAGDGGGISAGSMSTLTLNSSIISGNSASQDGGGISSYDANVNLYNSTVSNNLAIRGGGISSYDTTITLHESSISGNSATQGGGVYAYDTVVTLYSSTISGHTGADTGGGILAAASTTITLYNSTMASNSVTGSGGGIYAGSENTNIILNNATFSGNGASFFGGGIFARHADVTLNNTTFSANSATSTGGGGISANGTILSINNSIIANSAGGDCRKSGSPTITINNSLIESGDCGTATLSSDPNLGPLTGSPAYHPLLSPSLAIDAGDDALIPLGISTDQAGNSRIIGDAVDLGAFEWLGDDIFQDGFE